MISNLRSLVLRTLWLLALLVGVSCAGTQQTPTVMNQMTSSERHSLRLLTSEQHLRDEALAREYLDSNVNKQTDVTGPQQSFCVLPAGQSTEQCYFYNQGDSLTVSASATMSPPPSPLANYANELPNGDTEVFSPYLQYEYSNTSQDWNVVVTPRSAGPNAQCTTCGEGSPLPLYEWWTASGKSTFQGTLKITAVGTMPPVVGTGASCQSQMTDEVFTYATAQVSNSGLHGPGYGPPVAAWLMSAPCPTHSYPPCNFTTETVATTPTNRSRTTLGVNEQVALATTNAETFKVENGGSVNASNIYTAPNSAGLNTVDAVGVACATTKITFNVILPTGMLYVRTNGIRHTYDYGDVGIQTVFYLQPATVSFMNLYWKELNATYMATANGTWSCLNGVGHSPNQTYTKVGPEVGTLGSPVSNSIDTAYSGYCGNTRPTITASSATFNIPNVYSLSASDTGRTQFTDVVQTAKATSSGSLTQSKNSASGSTTVSSASSSY